MDKTMVRLLLCGGTIAAVSVFSLTLTRAQTPAPESDAPEPPAGLNGLTPDQMGQIAGSTVDGTGTAIAPADVDVMEGPRETPVAGPAAAALAPPPPGTIDEELLAANIAARLEPLDDCRISVARRKQVPTGDVAADRLALRWIIAKTGQAFGAEVVGKTPTDDAVLDCVKRQMTGWTFPRPSGGPLPIERDFTFRPVPPPAR